MNFFQGKSRRGSAANGLGIPKLEKKESFKSSEKGPSLDRAESFKKKSKSNLQREDSFRSASKDESSKHRGRRGSKLDPSQMPVPSSGSRRGSIQGGPPGPGARRGSINYDADDPFDMMAKASAAAAGKKSKSGSKSSAPKDTARRGSLSPNGRRTSVGEDHQPGTRLDPNANKSAAQSRTASVFVNAVQRVNSNQILMLKEIHGALHSLRMVHFAGTMTPYLKSPLDDTVTVKIPDPAKSRSTVPEIFNDILQVASDQRYFYECNFHTWTGNEEVLEDVLNSFSGKNIEFDSKTAYETVFEAYGSRAAWASLENGIKQLYTLYGNDSTKFISQELKEVVLRNIYILLGNWTAFTRLGHVALVCHIDEWFKKYSEEDWKTSNVPVVYGAFANGLDVLTLFGRIKNQIPTLDLIALRDCFKIIAQGIKKYPNQRDFLSLPMVRSLYQFQQQAKVIVLLLHIYRKMEGKSFEIFKSIDMFDLLSDDKKKAISFYSSLPKVISEAVGRAEKWGTVSTPAQFVAKFRQPAAITLLADLYSGIENQFQFGKSPVGTFITPKVSFLPSDDRETLRKRVKAVLGRKSKTQAQQTLMPEMSFRINVESDQSDLFSIPGIAIQVGDEQNNPKDLFAQVSSKLFSIQVEDSEEVIELVVPGGAPEIIAEESEESVGLNPEDLILPDSVNKTQIKLEYEFYETAEILYKETFGTINWTDMIKFMQKIGCKVEFEDGLGAMISRPECQWKISIRTPHPDMTFKSYEAEIIRCQLEDYYGLYFESFVRK